MPLIPLGIGAAKLYHNWATEAQEPNSMERRKDAIVERLTSGSNPRVNQLSDKQFDKFIKNNTIGKHAEEELRAVRNNAIVERMTSGSNPRVAQLSDKQFENFIKEKNISKHAEEELRVVRDNKGVVDTAIGG